MIQEILQKLKKKQDLNFDDCEFFIQKSISGEISEQEKIEILIEQNKKGITPEEISYFVKIISGDKFPEKPNEEIFDNCGTGGSKLSRINVSTTCAFVLAAVGVKIAKHGNKAASGRFGSFDLLEKLGFKIDLDFSRSKEIFEKLGIAFFFAPKIFPQIGTFTLTRKKIGEPTIFNLLGPLLSPLFPANQLIGTSSEKNAELIIHAAKNLRKKRVIVILGDKNLDEFSPTGKNQIWNLENEEIQTLEIYAKNFGLPEKNHSEILVKNPEENVIITEKFLRGEILDNTIADLLFCNCALGLKVANIEKSLPRGIEISRQIIKSGNAFSIFEKLKKMTNEN